MPLATLLNLPVTIVRRDDLGDEDERGNDLPTETLVETVGELQQQQRAEPADAGELSDTRWLLILPAGTDIRTGDGIVCDGQRYEMVGDPWHARNPRTQTASHVECTLRRTASPETAS